MPRQAAGKDVVRAEPCIPSAGKQCCVSLDVKSCTIKSQRYPSDVQRKPQETMDVSLTSVPHGAGGEGAASTTKLLLCNSAAPTKTAPVVAMNAFRNAIALAAHGLATAESLCATTMIDDRFLPNNCAEQSRCCLKAH